MCGILGIISTRGPVGLNDAEVARMRDTMSHRGPDGAGLWRSTDGAVVLAHRRLAVVDLSPKAAQPMTTADGRYVISYNGELYNDGELRAELLARANRFLTRSDTETVLAVIAESWADGPARLRGMYALAVYDTLTHRLLLARDPLGIKPLYWWTDSGDSPSFVFASEPRAILGHPDVAARPDWVTISSYLTTIRTTLGDRTLFAGIRTVRPGEVLELDLRARAPVTPRVVRRWASVPVGSRISAARVGDTVGQSVAAHLRADVPVCALLSGGLDSTIITRSASLYGLGSSGSVRTYSAGHDDGSTDSDLPCARRAAIELGTLHSEAFITRELFLGRWAEMVTRLGMPLSTPNEIASNLVARRLRADRQVVALSGEGADELFGGYDLILNAAAAFEAVARNADSEELALRRANLHIEANAWVPPTSKREVLAPAIWRACQQDAAMRAELASEFAQLAADAGPQATGLDVHLRYLRRVNLAGLLQRLDTSTMLEGVEGRTPFADQRVAECAESMPASAKFTPARDGRPAATKVPLRAAFAHDMPAWVLTRPKASFPLPFAGWLDGMGEFLRKSEFAATAFSCGSIEAVAQQPAALWRLAWPMINLAMWGDRHWGKGAGLADAGHGVEEAALSRGLSSVLARGKP